MTYKNTRRGNTQIVVKNQVIVNLIQDLQRLPLQFINNLRGKFQIKFGMTLLWNKRGFTLIELLVVVLIIGILVAVALPQYQKAVARSRAGSILSLGASIAAAEETYYLAHGNYAEFDLLDLDIPKGCTLVEDPDTLNSYACGRYFNFFLDPDGSVNFNYCPNNNASWANCKSTREFHLAFRLHNYKYQTERGQRRCSVYNDSKLGKTICVGLMGMGFVCGKGC